MDAWRRRQIKLKKEDKFVTKLQLFSQMFDSVLFVFLDKRDPKKRRVKPVERHLIQLDFGLSDSENDSDFEITEHDDPGK